MNEKEKWMMNWCFENAPNPTSDYIWKVAEKEYYKKMMEKNKNE